MPSPSDTPRRWEETGGPTLEVRAADSTSQAAAPERRAATWTGWAVPSCAELCRAVDVIGQQLLSKSTEVLQLWLVAESLLKEHILRRNQRVLQLKGSNLARLQMALMSRTLKVLPPNYSKCHGFGEGSGVGTLHWARAIGNRWRLEVAVQRFLAKNCNVV